MNRKNLASIVILVCSVVLDWVLLDGVGKHLVTASTAYAAGRNRGETLHAIDLFIAALRYPWATICAVVLSLLLVAILRKNDEQLFRWSVALFAIGIALSAFVLAHAITEHLFWVSRCFL